MEQERETEKLMILIDGGCIAISPGIRICCVYEPGIQRLQAVANISRSALCCHSNKTRAPVANTPNNAQLEGTHTIPPSYVRVRAVVWECSEGQADRQTHRRPCPIHISPQLCLMQNVINCDDMQCMLTWTQPEYSCMPSSLTALSIRRT